MTEPTIQDEYVKQLEDTIETLKSSQVDYIQQLEETNEFLTSELDGKWKQGCWFDRHRDNDKRTPVIRSDLKVMGVCVAYVVIDKDERWSVYYLRREETKKFSGYRFCRLEGSKNKPTRYTTPFHGTPLEVAKRLALGAIR
jgi:hypothetical protein